jgi:peroxiredoxin
MTKTAAFTAFAHNRPGRRMRAALHALFATIAAGAQGALAGEPRGMVEPGAYRATLESPGGELPFGLELARDASGWSGTLINAGERLPVKDVAVDGPHLSIKMPGYENRLTAVASDQGLRGELVLVKLKGKDQHMAFAAQRAQRYRFFPATAQASARVSGRWAVTFTEDDGNTEPAVGEFSQSGTVVSGTVLTDTGDHRYLEGQVRGNELYLSTFDGAHAFLYRAKIAADGTMSGDFWSGTAYHERFEARRDANARLADAYSLTHMRDGLTAFDFEFPDLAGKPVSSKDPRFRDKVLIVALAGSWCPNCHDEAAFLAPIYQEYRARGLEIVSLMFEHSGDFERAASAADRFRRHYGIEYTTLIAGISDKDEAARKLPMLDRVYAFPTMIFIDRRGRVRRIHTGYSGPATGEHHAQFVAEFKSLLDRLLAET